MNRRPQTFSIFRGLDQARRRLQSDVSARNGSVTPVRVVSAESAPSRLERSPDRSMPKSSPAANTDRPREPVSLAQAEVIVVGVPRVGKEAVCEFLARHGLKAAGVDLVASQPVPETLQTGTQSLIVALTMRPERLIAQRRLRPGPHGIGDVDVDIDAVRQEIGTARRQYSSMGWTSIDVTHNTPASTAARIIALWQRRQARPE